VPIVKLLVAAGAVPSIRDDNGFDAVEWARREMWEALDAVLVLFGAPSAPPGPVIDDDASVVARVREIERNGHTELAVMRMLEAFTRDETYGVSEATIGLPAADMRCIADAHRVLEAIAATSWVRPLRAYLERELRPAHVVRLLEHYTKT
jgi:hypothetical protein